MPNLNARCEAGSGKPSKAHSNQQWFRYYAAVFALLAAIGSGRAAPSVRDYTQPQTTKGGLGAQLGIDLNFVWQAIGRATIAIINGILWFSGNT